MATNQTPERRDAHVRTCPSCEYIGVMSVQNTWTRKCPKCGSSHSIRKFANKIDTSKKRHVFTCAVAECALNKPFFASLQRFCADQDAQLHVIPLPYRNSNPTRAAKRNPLPKVLAPYLAPTNMSSEDLLLVLSEVHVVATAEYPLNGLGVFGQQDLQVLGHPAVQLKTVPRALGRDPRITATTGAVTRARYSDSKAGAKARFHHVDGALLVEIDVETGYANSRHILADRFGGFYDLNQYWNAEGSQPSSQAAGLVMGDWHVAEADPIIEDVTLARGNPDSMRSVLNPEVVVAHDVHDNRAGSHHNTWYDKQYLYHAKKDSVVKEVALTCETLAEHAPVVVVNSNHDRHLQRWVENPQNENPKDGLFFNRLRTALIERAQAGHDDPATLEVAFKLLQGENTGVRFLKLGEAFLVKGIDCAQHGDQDYKGGRGGLTAYRQYATKMIVGHSHTPGISGGTMQVGAMLRKDATYAKGHSRGALYAHAVIYPNGKRALLFIKDDGRWRLPVEAPAARRKASGSR